MKIVFKKILILLLTMFIVSFCVFLSFEFINGDVATSILGIESTPEALEQLREEMGLNRPFLVRYFDWVGHFIVGDLGFSYSYNMDVSAILFGKLFINLVLTGIAFIFVVVMAIPLSVTAVWKKDGWLDKVICTINQVIMAVPPFFSGILITFVFGLTFRFFVPGGYISYEENFFGFISYMIFPAFSIALPKMAMVISLLRASLQTEIKKDYIMTAFSKGNNYYNVLVNHALKNAILPVVTFLGMTIADMMVGSIIIEQIFGIPGMGGVLINAISNRDYELTLAIIVTMAFFVVVFNTIVDICYRLIDPRIRKNGSIGEEA